ncbi:MAG TPA: hypothetical protein VFB62_08610, partial [Polyangiaceae bacterium]|nr:hypothetical protein [Polyangiaceae bacterium]
RTLSLCFSVSVFSRGTLSWLAYSVAVVGCNSEQLAPYACTCSFLTDTDGTSEERVEVCAPSAERAENEAKGCAQTAVPATVQGCRCQPAATGAACTRAHCRVER